MQRLITSLGLVLAFGVMSLAATQTFTNNTGGAVSGIRITFSDMVWITSYDKAVFPTQEPVGVVSEIAFSGGQLPNRGTFSLTWGEKYARVTSYAWLGAPTSSVASISHAGFSLTYDIDLTNPASHALSVTLTIRTKGISSLNLSTSRYHPAATANSPEHIEFAVVPAQGFSVRETQRTHRDPHGEPEQEPVWRLAFQEDATITVRYGRTFTRESESSGNDARAYLGSDLFLATGERYLILPEMQEGDVWGAAYADELQGIVVHYRLPDYWAMWTPWSALDSMTFDPCTYEGPTAASTNLTCLVMSTVVAGPAGSLTARSRMVGGTEVTLVFSRTMGNLDQTAEELLRGFELVQDLWGESIDAKYLGVNRPGFTGGWIT